MGDLMSEVERFRTMVAACPPELLQGEWECDYDGWADLYRAVLDFVDARSFARWSPQELQAVLYAVARDHEIQHLASEIHERGVETLLALAAAAVESGERNAKWQLADELGRIDPACTEAERLLLLLVHDENEYVRRRSLSALARLGSSAVEPLAVAAWSEPNEHQQWTRMNVLWCLHRIGSAHLAPFLAEAERDERPYLSAFAKRVRCGDVDS